MFVLSKWKRWCLDARKDIASFRKKLAKAEENVEFYKDKVRDLEISFSRIHPRWGEYEYVEMAMDLFNKYCGQVSQAGKLKDGRMSYWYYPRGRSGQSMLVVPNKELPDGYMRYLQKYEEPNRECAYCKKKFVLVSGYPAKNAKFCNESCFNNLVWEQEDRREKEEWHEGKDTD